jgi:hypothetical protein
MPKREKQDKQDERERDDLEEQDGELLPDREAMSVVLPDPYGPPTVWPDNLPPVE